MVICPIKFKNNERNTFWVHLVKYLKFFENELCFEDLLFFVCTLFNPICFKNHPNVLPCRSECRAVKKQCKDTINKSQLKWPALMNCNNLPEYETAVCLTRESIVTAKRKLILI